MPKGQPGDLKPSAPRVAFEHVSQYEKERENGPGAAEGAKFGEFGAESTDVIGRPSAYLRGKQWAEI